MTNIFNAPKSWKAPDYAWLTKYWEEKKRELLNEKEFTKENRTNITFSSDEPEWFL